MGVLGGLDVSACSVPSARIFGASCTKASDCSLKGEPHVPDTLNVILQLATAVSGQG